jgi:hypothetical protein
MLKNIVEAGRTDEKCGACALHAAHSRLQTHTQDTEYLLLYPCSNGCMNAAFNVLLYVRCLSGLFSTLTFY